MYARPSFNKTAALLAIVVGVGAGSYGIASAASGSSAATTTRRGRGTVLVLPGECTEPVAVPRMSERDASFEEWGRLTYVGRNSSPTSKGIQRA
jgi:hypothetical protein